MSDERSEGMPRTRGEGMPHDRGGAKVLPLNKEVAKKQKEALKKKKEVNDFLKAKVTQQELHTATDALYGGIVVMDEKINGVALRQEALLHTLRKFLPGFEKAFEDLGGRVQMWYDKVRALEDGNYHLREISNVAAEWNADPLNPPINFFSFDTKKLVGKILQDLDMNKAEKEVFLLELKTPLEAHTKIMEMVEKSFTPTTSEEQITE